MNIEEAITIWEKFGFTVTPSGIVLPGLVQEESRQKVRGWSQTPADKCQIPLSWLRN